MPVGPTGCNASRGDGEVRSSSGWQVSLMHGQSRSYLHFEDGTEPVMSQQTAIGSFGYFFPCGWSVMLSGGAVFGGTLRGDGHDLGFGPGFLVSVRVAWRFLEQDGAIPFMVASLTASFTRSASDGGTRRSHVVMGTDFRLGLTTGYTLFDILQIYVSPRVFGGPIFVPGLGGRVQGRDRYFFQVGLGGALLLPAGFTLFFDGSPGPERSLAGGIAVSF